MLQDYMQFNAPCVSKQEGGSIVLQSIIHIFSAHLFMSSLICHPSAVNSTSTNETNLTNGNDIPVNISAAKPRVYFGVDFLHFPQNFCKVISITMGDETPRERQDNEMEVLKAIYGDDLVDNRKQIAWNVWRPLDLVLTLKPLHSSTAAAVHCNLTLHISCCEQYPNKPPTIKVISVRGLSNDNASKLLETLKEEAAKLCGEVMIYELAQHVQNFLHKHYKPSKSFYEEMLERKNEQEKLKLQDQQNKESKERQKLNDEIQQREEILKAEGREGRRVMKTSVSQDSDESGQLKPQPELVFYAENKITPNTKKKTKEKPSNTPCACPKGIHILRVSQRNSRKVHIGKCIGHSSTGATTNIAIDAETGEHLIVKKWSLNLPSDIQARTRQMSSIEQDLATMSRLKTSSLVPYTAMETQYESDKRRSSCTCVYLLREFVLGTSLRHFRAKMSELSDNTETVKLVRHIASGVLSALKELHSVGVLHRDVRAENVYLEDSGLVRLVNAGLDLRLNEIIEGGSYCASHTKSHDIYCTAVLLLSLVSDPFFTGPQEIPSHLPSAMKDFFSRCLTEEEQSQWSAEQLLSHEFLRDILTQPPGIRDQDDGYSGSDGDDRALVRSLVNSNVPASGHSRLHAEFEILKWLGRGAFGDVLKVKNKLDGGFYAIKRIELNPESIQLNKKITREVKLLSRLNHENVVRYYNAWIETMESPILEDSNERGDSPLVNDVQKDQGKVYNSTEQAMAKLGVRLEWSMSELQPKNQRSSSSITDSSDSEDEEVDGWLKFRPATAEDSDGSSVEFEDDTDNKSQTLSSDTPTDMTRPQTANIHQVLYIQMEFCEKNTLRQAIDNGLYLEKIRGWRLFREIVEGLAHVHQRGMIHRDLKPVNIFIDSSDHVKIGDFGLATKVFTGLPAVEEDKSKAPEDYSESMTGQVGTALYVAPELLQAANKVIYNQKVDIYSLGIILFEMFHQSLETGMERMKILSDLRSKEIIMPKSFIVEENMKQIHVIRWLLNHDASTRPSCAELLASEHVPRAVPAGALSALISHTLSDRRSRGYQRLVAACLDQHFTPAEDLTYDSGVRTKCDPAIVAVRDIAISVFKRHGAVEFCPPLLLPRATGWDQYPNAVRLMTVSGCVVHLPHDLRLPFARYIAFTDTRYLRRYTVERVFREKHVPGFHPRELVESAFDIVAPKPANLWPDAELITVASSAISETGLKVSIQLNHTTILKLVLLACGIPSDKHADLYPVLVDVRTGRITNLQLQTHLTSLCLNARDTSLLLRLMESEVPVQGVKELLSPVTKKRSGWANLVTQAVHEMEVVARNAKALGAECTLTAVPCLAYNATQHDGIFWQAMSVRSSDQCKASHGKLRSGDLVAVGGRYDALVEEFRKIARSKKDDGETKTSAVGFAMSLERIAAIAKKNELDLSNESKKIVTVDQESVCICLWGAAGTGRSCLAASRRAQLAKELWARGLSCSTLECRGAGDARDLTGASVVLMLPDDDCGNVRLTRLQHERVIERRMALTEAVDYVQQHLRIKTRHSPEVSRSASWCEAEKMNNPLVSVMLITRDKLTSSTRRRYEAQAMGAAVGSLSMLSSTARLCVLALSCEGATVRRLAAELDAPLSEPELTRAFHNVQDAFPRQQRILSEALDVVSNIIKNYGEETPAVALYSIPDGLFKLVT